MNVSACSHEWVTTVSTGGTYVECRWCRQRYSGSGNTEPSIGLFGPGTLDVTSAVETEKQRVIRAAVKLVDETFRPGNDGFEMDLRARLSPGWTEPTEPPEYQTRGGYRYRWNGKAFEQLIYGLGKEWVPVKGFSCSMQADDIAGLAKLMGYMPDRREVQNG